MKLIHEVHDMWPETPVRLGSFSRWHPFIIAMQIAENSAYRRSDYVVSLPPLAETYMKRHGEITLSLLDGGTASPPETFYYLTCHREENTRDDDTLTELFRAMERLDAPVLYPVHPRNTERARRVQQKLACNNLILTQPVGYLESVCMVRHAKKIITDSGGLQREAFFAEKKCVTLLDFVCWPETMVDGRNTLCRPDAAEILEKLERPQTIRKDYQPFGDGHSAEKIVQAMEEAFSRRAK